jgi:hypothetical protein
MNGPAGAIADGRDMSSRSAPSRLLRPKLAFFQSTLAGGFAGHALYLLLAASTAGWPLAAALDFNDVVVLILGFIGSFFIALVPICMTGLIAAPIAWGVHSLFRRSGLDYRAVCILAGALIAIVSVNLFFGLSDGFAERFASIDGLSIFCALAGGAIAGLIFWRLAVRPMLAVG